MKLLVAVQGNDIAPRLDMTREILVYSITDGVVTDEPRTILLDKDSAEDICSFIIKEDISCIICGGIEDRHYKYLQWKKTMVIDSIIGPYRKALKLFLDDALSPQAILTSSEKI